MKKITKLVFMVSVFIFCGASLAKEQVEKNAEDTQQETKFNDEATEDLFRAVEKGDVLAVEQAIQRGANVNAQYKGGSTPLHYSARRQKADVMAVLISYGADVNAKDEYGNTPLHKCWRPASINILLKNGADPNVKNKEGKTPLHFWESMFIYYFPQWADAMAALISYGADVNAKDETGNTPLHNCWQPAGIKILLENGADVNAKDKYGKTPLFYRTLLEQTSGVEVLIAHGADVGARDRSGDTPLHNCWRPESIKILLENGADVNAKDETGNTPLHNCWTPGGVKILLENGADVNAKDETGNTPLHNCWTPGVTKILLENGADPNVKNKEGKTPLQLINSAEWYSLSTLKTLCSYGANPNVTDENGLSLLNFVRQRGEYWEYYGLWMKHVRKNEPENKKRWSATTKLIMALRSGDVTGIEQAIESGAFTDYSFNDGTTLLDIARNHNFTASDEQTTDEKKVKEILLDACKAKQQHGQQEEKEPQKVDEAVEG